jgi:hypothetical protein
MPQFQPTVSGRRQIETGQTRWHETAAGGGWKLSVGIAGLCDAGMPGAVGKAPGDWRTPRRFAHTGAVKFAPASWSAAALRRFDIRPGMGFANSLRPFGWRLRTDGKAPGDWRTPGRFAHTGAVKFAPASWSAAALRRFDIRPGMGFANSLRPFGWRLRTDGKAPEDWRTPRRFAHREPQPSRQRLGVRRPSAAFPRAPPKISASHPNSAKAFSHHAGN